MENSLEQKVVIQVPVRDAQGWKGEFQHSWFLVAQGKDVTQWHEKEAAGIIHNIKKNRISGKLQIQYGITFISLIRELIGTRLSQPATNK